MENLRLISVSGPQTGTPILWWSFMQLGRSTRLGKNKKDIRRQAGIQVVKNYNNQSSKIHIAPVLLRTGGTYPV